MRRTAPQSRRPDRRRIPSLPHACRSSPTLTCAACCWRRRPYAEGALALTPVLRERLSDEERRPAVSRSRCARRLLDILTPMVKSLAVRVVRSRPTDLAIQVLGGAGYTRDYPVEQYCIATTA
jgi:alkylation response protein AidB-like acyl-CoA dehydrogenase